MSIIPNRNKMLGRTLDPRANGHEDMVYPLRRIENLSEEQEGMVERLGEMRKGRRERIENGSTERIIEKSERDKRQFEAKEG